MPLVQWLDKKTFRVLRQWRPQAIPWSKVMHDNPDAIICGDTINVKWQRGIWPCRVVALGDSLTEHDNAHEVSNILWHAPVREWRKEWNPLITDKPNALMILAKETDEDRILYLVQWHGYGAQLDTLEPLENISDCDAYKQYKQKNDKYDER